MNINEFGLSPLRSRRDYSEKVAKEQGLFTQKIDFIFKQLMNFKYGVAFVDGRILQNLNDIDKQDGENIYIQSPMQFYKNKTGMCHDATILIDALLMKEKIKHQCIFIYSEEPPFYPTHSFVIAFCNDGFYRIIDVFSTKKCVYNEKFKSLKDALIYRIKLWIKYDNKGKENIYVFIGDHVGYPKKDFLSWFYQTIKIMKKIN